MVRLFKGSKEFYEANADRYREFERAIDEGKTAVPELSDFRRHERQRLERIRGNIVYVGAGTGNHLVPLAQKGNRVVALETSPQMLDLSKAHLQSAGIPFQIASAQTAKTEIERFLDGGKGVLLVHGDAKKIDLPQKFDWAVSYCTLPLMGRWLGWRHVLRKISDSANNVVVSVYAKESLRRLATAYSQFGFLPKVFGRTISVKGGFRYSVIPEDRMVKAMNGWHSDIEKHPMGAIYTFQRRGGLIEIRI